MQNPISEIRQRKENLKSINRDYLEEKKRIQSRSQLKEKVIREKLKDLSNETVEEISDEREALDQFWEETKAKTLIENKDPEDAVKALHAQNLAGERLPSSGDPGEIVSVVEEELNDPANTENYKRELWQLAARKLQGQDSWDMHKPKMEDLRKEHLLNDNDLQKLRIREALKDTEGRKTNLKTMGNTIYKQIESGQIEDEDELEDKFQNYFGPIMEDLEEAFQEV